MPIHQPVLLDEVLQYLRPVAGRSYVDGTLGEGGHAEAILERSSPGGRLLGVDRDPDTLVRARLRLARFGDRVELIHGSYAEIPRYLERHDWRGADGILVDLGLNTLQLDDPQRGFSFAREGPLDMRFDPTAETTAADLVNHLSERDLADLIFRYGEERRSRAIARRIVSSRPLGTTSDLRRVVLSALGGRRRGGIDPATRTFQALRIAVNQELESAYTLPRVRRTLPESRGESGDHLLPFSGGPGSQMVLSGEGERRRRFTLSNCHTQACATEFAGGGAQSQSAKRQVEGVGKGGL